MKEAWNESYNKDNSTQREIIRLDGDLGFDVVIPVLGEKRARTRRGHCFFCFFLLFLKESKTPRREREREKEKKERYMPVSRPITLVDSQGRRI
jgi:hypothetical protein